MEAPPISFALLLGGSNSTSSPDYRATMTQEKELIRQALTGIRQKVLDCHASAIFGTRFFDDHNQTEVLKSWANTMDVLRKRQVEQCEEAQRALNILETSQWRMVPGVFESMREKMESTRNNSLWTLDWFVEVAAEVDELIELTTENQSWS